MKSILIEYVLIWLQPDMEKCLDSEQRDWVWMSIQVGPIINVKCSRQPQTWIKHRLVTVRGERGLSRELSAWNVCWTPHTSPRTACRLINIYAHIILTCEGSIWCISHLVYLQEGVYRRISLIRPLGRVSRQMNTCILNTGIDLILCLVGQEEA